MDVLHFAVCNVYSRLIDKSSSIGVIFVDEENVDEVRIIKELEHIHDELMEQESVHDICKSRLRS